MSQAIGPIPAEIPVDWIRWRHVGFIGADRGGLVTPPG